MKRLLWLIIITGLLLPAGVWAEEAKLYKYVDDQGVTHFTDSLEAIPEKYRSDVKQTEAIVSEPGSETSPAPNPSPDAVKEAKPSAEETSKAKQRVEYDELKAHEQELTEQLEQLDEDLSQAARRKSKSGKDKHDWKQLKQQKEVLEQDLENTRDRMLEIEPAD